MKRHKTLIAILIIIVATFLFKFGMKRIWLASDAKPYRVENIEAPTGEEKILLGQKIDINSAPRDHLILLPGIGPKLADRIIAARPFLSPEDLKKVKGIGPYRLAKVRQFIDIK